MAKKNFTFPPLLLEQINECSNNGFVLFSFDQDGNPQVHAQFDNQASAMALQYYMDNWSESIKGLNIQITTSQMMDGKRRKKK